MNWSDYNTLLKSLESRREAIFREMSLLAIPKELSALLKIPVGEGPESAERFRRKRDGFFALVQELGHVSDLVSELKRRGLQAGSRITRTGVSDRGTGDWRGSACGARV